MNREELAAHIYASVARRVKLKGDPVSTIAFMLPSKAFEAADHFLNEAFKQRCSKPSIETSSDKLSTEQKTVEDCNSSGVGHRYICVRCGDDLIPSVATSSTTVAEGAASNSYSDSVYDCELHGKVIRPNCGECYEMLFNEGLSKDGNVDAQKYFKCDHRWLARGPDRFYCPRCDCSKLIHPAPAKPCEHQWQSKLWEDHRYIHCLKCGAKEEPAKPCEHKWVSDGGECYYCSKCKIPKVLYNDLMKGPAKPKRAREWAILVDKNGGVLEIQSDPIDRPNVRMVRVREILDTEEE